MRNLNLCFLVLFLLSASIVTAQLQRGDHLLGFGQHIAFQNVAYDVALDDGLLSLGSASGTGGGTQLYSLPNYSWMLTNRLQLAAGVTTSGRQAIGDADLFGMNLGLRGYLTNDPGGAVYVGVDYLRLTGQLVGEQTISGIYPNGGFTVNLGETVQMSNEIGAVLANHDIPTQLLFSIQLSFLLSPTAAETQRELPKVASGTIMLGTGGLSYTRVANSGLGQFLISPEAHYFATPTTAIGIRGKYQSVLDNDQGMEGPARAIGVGASVRQFIYPFRRTFAPFVQVGFLHNWLNADVASLGYYTYRQTEGRYVSLDAAVGGLIFLKPALALELGLGYTDIRAESHPAVGKERALALTLGGRFMIN